MDGAHQSECFTNINGEMAEWFKVLAWTKSPGAIWDAKRSAGARRGRAMDGAHQSECFTNINGEMAEWFKVLAWKASVR